MRSALQSQNTLYKVFSVSKQGNYFRQRQHKFQISAIAAPPKVAQAPKVKSVDFRNEDTNRGLYTTTNPEQRRIKPEDPRDRIYVKFVYVVLEAQYQSAVGSAVKKLNVENEKVCFESVGYLLEELRDESNFNALKKDMETCNIFVGSLIFIEELADKIISVIEPKRESLDACLIFPSMPAVMKLNKIGKFSMSNLGQSKSIFTDLVKKAKQNEGFEEGMLKIVRTLPKILKYLPSEKAQDTKNYVNSLQYWLGGNQQNLENMLKNIAQDYVPSLKGTNMQIQEPQLFTDVGIWHPLAPKMFEDRNEYMKWYNNRTDITFSETSPPTVGIVLQKSHLITGDAGHYEGVVMEIEAKGARVVPVFSGGLDFGTPVKRFFIDSSDQASVDCVLNLTGFALVGGPARQDSDKAIQALKKLNVPYLVSLPLIFQTTEEWLDSELGLHPVQVALQVALPEIDGGMEPIIFAGRDSNTGKAHSIPDRITSVCGRAVNWARLRKLKNAQKKLAITIFSFPPDKGNIGTAAYLNVFSSIHKVMVGLKEQGYDVGEMPMEDGKLMQQVLQQEEAKYNSADLNIHYRMGVREYEKLCDYSQALEENWGKPPGKLNTNGNDLLIFGKQYGNIFIGVQPTFGYEGDPMRLLFSRSASPHHGFAAYYTYVEKIFGANAVLHFGTHGSLEFMPGKQVGMSDVCYPDSLIGNIPNIYYYAANNPSEATIAKRRSYAATISYLTPPAENAGLYKGLKELKELVSSYQGMRETGRATQVVASIIETAKQCNMERDVELPASDEAAKQLDLDARDNIVGGVYKQLMEIESRLLPCGLHVVGVPPSCDEAIATLVNIAEVDRPENKPPVKGLPGILARSIGENMENIYAQNNKGKLEAVEKLQRINDMSRMIIKEFVAEKTDGQNRVIGDSILDKMGKMFGQTDKYMKVVEASEYKKANKEELQNTFTFLQFCVTQIVKDRELQSLTEALDGKYVEPGPGGDPIRNPGILPTGKNIHALDPQSIPTMAAVQSAKTVVDRLLEREKQVNGGLYPETIALVLWGTDNIKTYGESLAQVLCMIGIEPVSDAIGRVNKLRVIPLEQLRRPRVDVVVNCSGVFRDLFVNQMILLDRAVKMAAELDEPLEMNFVRKHALEQSEKLGVSLREAATRVFSNSSGSYSSNVNLAVENSSWQDEQQLQDMYVKRKSYSYNSDRPGAGGEMNQELFQNALSTASVTFQNLDSSEISLTDVSHYFDSDPTNLVQSLRKDGKKPSAYIADTTTANAQVRTLSETVRLDSRTKLLNPKWYEGMMKSGYEGVREIQKRLNNTMGWSATSGQVDNWVYNEANDTFINDADMAQRLMQTNPNSFRKLVANFLEASGRGYWDASEEQIEKLKQLYMDVEDKIEGVE